jgi:RimJ/RimL family protein N-acetyltransferase
MKIEKIMPLKVEQAREITNWKYTEPYDFYNMIEDEETIDELMDGTYFSAENSQNELIGYFCFGKNAQVPGGVKVEAYTDESYTDIGLGVHPKLTGQGYGLSFIEKGLEYWKSQTGLSKFRLSVATFNKEYLIASSSNRLSFLCPILVNSSIFSFNRVKCRNWHLRNNSD